MSFRTLCGIFAARAALFAHLSMLCVLTAACSTAPARPSAGPDPSDPKARAPAAAYRPVLGGYVSQRPAEPAPWRELNERVAPAPKP